ncbi:hypothetical protein PACTADRAFT_48552 [Pachysolen tannophilus NRRL Y-2460]|uniref:Transcription elongation factor SPT5 n=1 Tax=Pachysolen tannophilus NRRL Y-2460 TaxID=669874 RepID=A0A1E4TYB0_PACTA|nr:hypothetical protein PACTADRAFT_48552 [Pachysolen tannophilus NRRL Y-2460]
MSDKEENNSLASQREDNLGKEAEMVSGSSGTSSTSGTSVDKNELKEEGRKVESTEGETDVRVPEEEKLSRKRPRSDDEDSGEKGRKDQKDGGDDIANGEQQQDEDDEDDEQDDDEEENDEDEDDDELDEDEEDEVRSKKRRRRNQFLDVEAEVDEDEEEEDEDEEEAELLKQTFLADDHAPEGEEGAEGRRSFNDARIHRKLAREEQQDEEQDAQELAQAFKDRYGRSATSKFTGASSAQVPQRLLLPSVDDPSIWGIRCRPGKEKEIVRLILKKKISLQNSNRPLDIYSCFQRDNFTGYIYIEARKIEAVNQALNGLVGVFGNSPKVLVPVEEYPALLKSSQSSDVEVVPGIYCRIKQGKYKGDLALVENLAENGLEVRLKLVPRLDYGRHGTQQEYIDKNGLKKTRVIQNNKIRPPPRLFNEQEASTHDPRNLVRRGRSSYTYKGEEYTNGFLYKDFRLAIVNLKNINPTLEELTRFNSGNQEEGIDLSSIAQSLKQSSNELITFQPGDKVEVVNGEQAGIKGKVLASQQSKIVKLVIDSDAKGTTIEIPTNNLRKIFLEGDHVRVIHGHHIDDTGLIVSVNGDQVTFISDQTRNAVTVFSNYLIKSTDTTTSFSKVGRFELHDLVQLNSDAVGLIIRAEKEVFTVLKTDGRTVEVSPSSIQSKLDLSKTQEIATDKNGLEIKVGDTIKETKGERRTGTILHIYRSSLFLQSKTLTENLGVFLTNSFNVETISAKGSISGQFKTPDLTKMNPSRKLGPVSTSSSAPKIAGRDFSINTRVKIISGGHKGKKGIIKDANGEIARVELHAPNKLVTINKSHLKYEVDQTGTYIDYREFLSTRGKGYRGGSSGSSGGDSFSQRPPAGSAYDAHYSSQNPSGRASAWGSHTGVAAPGSSWGGVGSKTPAWSSNGGKTPAWSSNGSKTPGWSSSQGNRSAWGTSSSKTPTWGGAGGRTPAWGTSGGKTPAYEGGSRTPGWGVSGGKSSYGGKSAWDPNSGLNDDRYLGVQNANSWEPAPTPGNVAPTPGSWNAPTPSVNDDDASYEPN